MTKEEFTYGMKILFRVTTPLWFVDKLHWSIGGGYQVDILMFDDKFLKMKFKNYEDSGKSIKDIILENYGQEAVDFLIENKPLSFSNL